MAHYPADDAEQRRIEARKFTGDLNSAFSPLDVWIRIDVAEATRKADAPFSLLGKNDYAEIVRCYAMAQATEIVLPVIEGF